MKMIKKLIIAVAALLALVGSGRAQQDGQFSQFYANRVFFTPAAIVGTDELFRASLTDREQWWGGGRKDRPSYRTLNATQFFMGKKMGVGLTVYEWNQNVEVNLLAKLSYAYHLQVGQEAFMSFGLNAGVMQGWYKDLILPDGTRAPEVDAAVKTKPNLDLGLGVEFYTREIVAGVSVQHLPIRLSKESKMLALHAYYYFGYLNKINRDWSIYPMLMMRMAGRSANLDITLRAFYSDLLHFGAGYRLDAVVLMAGVNIGPHFTFSYSFDYPLSTIRNQFKMPSHEFVLSYRGCLHCPYNNTMPINAFD